MKALSLVAQLKYMDVGTNKRCVAEQIKSDKVEDSKTVVMDEVKI